MTPENEEIRDRFVSRFNEILPSRPRRREMAFAAIVTALVMGSCNVFAAPLCIPSADGFLPPGCPESSVATLREWLLASVLFLLFVGSVLVLHVLMRRDAPEDEGSVKRGYYPRRTR